MPAAQPVAALGPYTGYVYSVDGTDSISHSNLFLREQQEEVSGRADRSDGCKDRQCRERYAAFYKMSELAGRMENITTRSMFVQAWVDKAIWYSEEKEYDQARGKLPEFDQTHTETLAFGDGTCGDFAGLKAVAMRIAHTPIENMLLVKGNIIDTVDPKRGVGHKILVVYDPAERQDLVLTTDIDVRVQTGQPYGSARMRLCSLCRAAPHRMLLCAA